MCVFGAIEYVTYIIEEKNIIIFASIFVHNLFSA